MDNEGVQLDSETIRQRKLIREGMGTVMREKDKPAPGVWVYLSMCVCVLARVSPE